MVSGVSSALSSTKINDELGMGKAKAVLKEPRLVALEILHYQCFLSIGRLLVVNTLSETWLGDSFLWIMPDQILEDTKFWQIPNYVYQ